ncbi:hypothetical protein S7335_5001 [Synechococcus sp. PCC 7335]|uniref:hypothetical protein n=1 Tax=Synechococcus sp. (strain ATCC 29403 / PCC 7335) TaxID=91464 RepID=UPI00017EBFCF|nr:hypothetical protein [Synechococcus sp. PCC 7335]EDX87293.1 hypothetical protein S7335_5001 [Synechococcus sp. PCC 7335]
MRLSLFLALVATLSLGSISKAQTVSRTPLSSPIELSGQTGGPEQSACGNIDPRASQTIQVTEDFASLSFQVESEGDYTLLITGPDGFRECVFAHNYDDGSIHAPGLLTQGEYQVFVGDRRGERHPYTLSITQ